MDTLPGFAQVKICVGEILRLLLTGEVNVYNEVGLVTVLLHDDIIIAVTSMRLSKRYCVDFIMYF